MQGNANFDPADSVVDVLIVPDHHQTGAIDAANWQV
jgi:hypothetical protein